MRYAHRLRQVETHTQSVQNALMSFDDRPPAAIRLEKARARRFKTAAAACAFFGWNYSTYAQHESGIRGIGRAAAKYAEAFKVSEAWLLTGEGGESEKRAGVRTVRVAAHVQAGQWAETWEWPDDDQYEVAVPDEPQLAAFKLFAAETRGPSMNRRYPERTVVVFTDVDETHESPVPGKRYVVQRLRADGQREHTVKLLHRDEDGKLWLVPESTDPLFQSPISLEDGTNDGDVVAIIGRVHFAVTRE